MKRFMLTALAAWSAAPAIAQDVRTITRGAVDQTVYVRIVDATDGTPETGVTSATSGLDLEYVRNGAAATDLTESDLAAAGSAHSDGGIIHVGAGVYRVDLPDAAVASGSTSVLVGGSVTGMVVIPARVQLVALDLQTATVNVGQIEGADATDQIGAAAWASATRTLTAATNITSSGAAVPMSAGGYVQGDMQSILGTALDNTGTGTTFGQTLATNISRFFGSTQNWTLPVAGASKLYDVNSVTTKLDTMVRDDAGQWEFDPDALEEAPTGGGASASAIADAVWDEARSGHVAAGTFGEAVPVTGNVTLTSTAMEAVADEVRAELATELGRLDAAVSAAVTPATTAATQATTAATQATTAAAQSTAAAASAAAVVGRLPANNRTIAAAGDTATTLDEVTGGGGAADWTTAERAQIRHRLGLDGAATAPATGVPSLATPASVWAAIDAAGIRSAVGLAAANLDDQFNGISVTLTPDDINEIVAGINEGIAPPRVNDPPDPGFTFQVSRRADGTYKCTRPLRVAPGSVETLHPAIDMSPLFGRTNPVQTVGTPAISGGSLAVAAEGPRDQYAIIEVEGTATAGEERTITVPVTMRTGATVQVKLDVEVFAE